MFGPQGIYANPDDRAGLNVPGSLEYFDPNNPSVNYSALVEIQMYGGVGASPNT